MQVIDEKPKRGHEKVKQQSKRRLWKMVFIVSCVMFLGLSFAYIGLCVMIPGCGSASHQNPLELTATVIVLTNMNVETQLTVTRGIPDVPSFTTSTRVARTATAISIQQTQLAATQSVLHTQQAQLIPTLTALAMGTP